MLLLQLGLTLFPWLKQEVDQAIFQPVATFSFIPDLID